jgi:hypothetical protein
MIAIPLALLLLLALRLLLPWQVVLGLYALFATAFLYFLLQAVREVDVKAPEPDELGELADLEEEWKAHGRVPRDHDLERVA